MNKLEKILTPLVEAFPTSRIHLLRHNFGNDKQVYIKRDDELGFGISGSKLRKYQSLLPVLKNQGIKSAILLGGPYSNNILSLAQVLIENNIKPFLFLRGEAPLEKKGNFLLTSLFVPLEHQYWIPRNQWIDVEAIATKAAVNFPKPWIIIPEGACMEPSLAGAATLAIDILKNQQQKKIQFNHLFIEAGTGLSAIGLILGLGYIPSIKLNVHVLLLADDETLFRQKLKHYHAAFSKIIRDQIPYLEDNIQLNFYTPTVAKSFGSVNKGVLETIVKVARREGFLTDPIYSAKLYSESVRIIETQNLSGNSLIIHSGGALTLMGYADVLKEIADQLQA